MLKTTLLAGLVLSVAAMPLLAQERGGPGRHMELNFETLDADGDGQITTSDLKAMRATRFAELDSDGDGQVSRAEFMAHASARAGDRAEARFDRIDTDGDGFLTQDTIDMGATRGRGSMGERLISRFDTDEDGGVSLEEFEAFEERRAEMRGKHGGKGGRHGGFGFDRN